MVAPSSSPAAGLADLLRDGTKSLHGRAERTGVVRDLLSGTASRGDYVLYLRNLLPAYEALEAGLESHREVPGIAAIARPALYRAASIHTDLVALAGAEWNEKLPLLAAAREYATRIAEVARREPRLLVAHAYVRYLGDLSGGRVLRKLLARTLALGEEAMHFYTFRAITDESGFRAEFRAAIDAAGTGLDARERRGVVGEGKAAFDHNIRISEAVAARAS